MKILIVQDHLRSGGTERQSVLLANAFAAAGHVTTLLTFRPGGALAQTVGPNVQRITLQTHDRNLDWFAPGLIAAVRQVAPDIVLCMGRMANCYAGRIQRQCASATVISTMRTGKSLPWLFRRSLNVTQHIVANSEDARQTLIQQHGVSAEEVSVIYNSLVFPAESSLARNDALRNEHGANATTLVLLCVAMFRPEKNQRELIEIAASLPPQVDWQLWLAGDGPARAACEQLAATKSVTDRVKFTGFLRNPAPLYAAADVAVHASSSEALSNFLIEAQAHGLPAVAYAAQGIGETFVPGRTGWLIARDDRRSFCAVIEKLTAQSPREREALASEARCFARTTFDPATQVRAYLDLFEKLRKLPRP